MESGRIVGGKYRLRRQIGEGGMGSVWAAVHETLDRTVAIKFLRPSGVNADMASARFVAEAKSAARVKHRFVVDVFDFGITELGEYYMVQELLEGEELTDCMVRGPAWEVADVVRFIAQCLSGLEAVHQVGIVHRDLKPENIFVMRDSDGRVPKLLDFGISKSSDAATSRGAARATQHGRQRQLTSQDVTLGSPWYMSPEQLRGRPDLDVRADIYSMGVILYEWLAGRVPYEEENLSELALQIASGSATPLVSLRPELGHDLSSLIARALTPEADGRYASCAEMRDALLSLVPSLPRAWSMVQKSSGKPGETTPMPNRTRGAKTEALLSAAADAFGDDRGPSWLGRLRKRGVQRLAIAGAALLAVVLVAIPLFRDARPERAVAHDTPPIAQQPPRDAARPTVAPEVAPAPLDVRDSAPAAPASAADEKPAAHEAKPAAVRHSSAHKAQPRSGHRKLIRTLDF